MIATRTRTRKCLACGISFSYPVGQGTDRKHCSASCRIKHKWKLKVAAAPPCSTPGCDNPAHYVSLGICNSCYCRIKRTGTAEKRKSVKGRLASKMGYVVVYDMTHPLSIKTMAGVFQHRQVLYDAIGTGPHPCFWCGKVLEWPQIVVDHLNDVKHDNRLENLAVACNKCNRARGALIPFLKGMRPKSLEAFVSLCRATVHPNRGE